MIFLTGGKNKVFIKPPDFSTASLENLYLQFNI
jgi:hypothetical protein